MNHKNKRYATIAIPLSRPEIVDFLLHRSEIPRGAAVEIIGQRPTQAAEAAWITHLQKLEQPTVEDLLKIDNPHAYLMQSWTDRLVPVEFLNQPDFLIRNLGGWAPVYLGVMGLPNPMPKDDPLLRELEILTEYGESIRYFGADPDQVASRLEQVLNTDLDTLVLSLGQLQALRWQMADKREKYVDQLYGALMGHTPLNIHISVPELLLFDELLGQMIKLETRRRITLVEEQMEHAQKIEEKQHFWEEEQQLKLILKGEYIAGRHRRSTVLIAPELGVVIKQPAPEPFHEIALSAKTFNDQVENWPYTTGNGELVTPRGRVRLILEENLVPRLTEALGHPLRISTLLGLTVERFVPGPTLQEYVLSDPRRMTLELYTEIVLHQQVCELLGGENGDWHSANFIVREKDKALIHIDWGAARPLREDEYNPTEKQARLDQVKNLAYSFHDDDLADLVSQRHAEFTAEETHLQQVKQKARRLLAEANLLPG